MVPSPHTCVTTTGPKSTGSHNVNSFYRTPRQISVTSFLLGHTQRQSPMFFTDSFLLPTFLRSLLLRDPDSTVRTESLVSHRLQRSRHPVQTTTTHLAKIYQIRNWIVTLRVVGQTRRSYFNSGERCHVGGRVDTRPPGVKDLPPLSVLCRPGPFPSPGRGSVFVGRVVPRKRREFLLGRL